MTDRRAHQRIDGIELKLMDQFEHLARIDNAVTENTRLTTEIVTNTTELVNMVKGIKGLRTLIMWLAPAVAAIVVFIGYFK